MQFEDEGYIIKQQKYAENSLILTVVSKNHGKVVGFVKSCVHKKNLATFQLGNKIKFDAYSRLEENMLSLKTELQIPTAVYFLMDSRKLEALSSLCGLCNSTLMQNEPLSGFYKRIDNFFMNISQANWLEHYAKFEYYLLDFLGIGLDLSKCAVTGKTDNLRYISPKSGKAVCEEVGKIYADKLFKYPEFLFNPGANGEKSEIYDLLKMTEFFLKKNFFAAHDLQFPNNRDNLLKKLIL